MYIVQKGPFQDVTLQKYVIELQKCVLRLALFAQYIYTLH